VKKGSSSSSKSSMIERGGEKRNMKPHKKENASKGYSKSEREKETKTTRSDKIANVPRRFFSFAL
jgi:DUF4097 and DUF4098 domain-containing protein YvlB